MARLHPSAWPFTLWVAISYVVALLRVDYTLGAFSFVPAVGLLAGTWLGSSRGAASQALASAALIPTALWVPGLTNPGEWGYRVGIIGAAALAGVVATPDGNGAHPPARLRTAVFGLAGGTAALVFLIVPQLNGAVGVYFALTFLLATAIASFYAYRLVPEPGRVVGYVFCLVPYYAAGVGWGVALPYLYPQAAASAAIPAGWREAAFHGYLAHLPGELIAIVVIAYLVCAVERRGEASGPLAISASR